MQGELRYFGQPPTPGRLAANVASTNQHNVSNHASFACVGQLGAYHIHAAMFGNPWLTTIRVPYLAQVLHKEVRVIWAEILRPWDIEICGARVISSGDQGLAKRTVTVRRLMDPSVT